VKKQNCWIGFIGCVFVVFSTGVSFAKDIKAMKLLELSLSCHARVLTNNNPGAVFGYQRLFTFQDAGKSFVITEEEIEIYSAKDLPVIKTTTKTKAKYNEIGKILIDQSTLNIKCKKSQYCFDEELISECKNSVCSKPESFRDGDSEGNKRKTNVETITFCDKEAASNAKVALELLSKSEN
jgi:hypothetical protein